jgi:hypothetical protein
MSAKQSKGKETESNNCSNEEGLEDFKLIAPTRASLQNEDITIEKKEKCASSFMGTRG